MHGHGEGSAQVPGAPPPGQIAAAPGSPERSLALCLPSFAAGTDWQYFPVAATGGSLSGQPWTGNLSEACHLPEGSSAGIFDVVIRNSSTNEQRLLLGH